MSASTMELKTQTGHADVTQDAFDLDVSIVEAGDAVDALLCSTDNGCGTQSHNGC
jgi:FxLD family lantipeptide